MKYFVTGIDTDSGKTLASAILCEALEADYWKPIQSGLPRDADTIRELISNPNTTIHPEQYLMKTPASPHAAAKLDGIDIELEKIQIPETSNTLVIEGAGGCLVPLNETHFIIDIPKQIGATIILVADLYLGSINHTLLTVEAIRKRNLPIAGIIFNGTPNFESERIIQHHTLLKVLLHIQREEVVNKAVVKKYAQQLKEKLSR